MIKLKRLLESVLSEKVSDVVYHTTDSFQKIIDTDTFKLSPLSKTDRVDKEWAEENGLIDYYYMSVARSLSSNFTTATYNDEKVVLRLDGRKLNNNFKSFPYDYGSEGKRRGIAVTSIGDEMEDRIVSKKPIIKKFTSYITGVYIPRHYIEFLINHEIGELISTIEKLISLGIDVYICPKSRIPTFSSKCKVDIDDVDKLIREIW